MILAINCSHVDISLALRQMLWIGFLSEKNGNSMLNESLVLTASRRASRYPKFQYLDWLAARIFGRYTCHIPDTEHEVGWPGAANWLFGRALFHVEQFEDDVFFLEPDAMPLVPTWYDRIQEEWVVAQENGKTFMGAMVPKPDHMTGIAVYGKGWRKVAPSLVSVPDAEPWDVYSAPEVVPDCHFVEIIQHVFRRHDPGWSVPSLAIVDPKAVIFHQDKQGKLVCLLDQEYHSGECSIHPLFGPAVISSEEKVMRKFYYAVNATRAIQSHGKRFLFEALDCHGGAIPGAFSTESETDQVALADLTCNPTTGVTEISQQEWENVTKKKAPLAQNSNISKPWSGTLPQAALSTTPSGKAAVVVAEAASSASRDGTPGVIKDIADVIKTDVVQPAQTANIGTKLPRPEQRKQFNINREKAA